MIIEFPINENPYNQSKLWFADKIRPSSMTGVTLLEPGLLVCSSHWMREIYLVNFDESNFEIIDKQTTISKNMPIQTELLDSVRTKHGHRVFASNFSNHPISSYEVRDGKIRFQRSFPETELGICHGVKFHSDDKFFVAISGVSNPNKGVYGFSESKSEPFFHLRHDWLCKDIGFLDENTMVLLVCSGAPNKNERRIYNTAIEVYDIKGKNRLLHRSEFKETHADSVKVHEGRVFVTVEEAVGDGMVWEFEFDNTLNFVRNLGQYSFPHGIDIKFGVSAVTEYGRSTVVISEIGCASP